MRSFIKIALVAAGIATMTACESKKPTEETATTDSVTTTTTTTDTVNVEAAKPDTMAAAPAADTTVAK